MYKKPQFKLTAHGDSGEALIVATEIGFLGDGICSLLHGIRDVDAVKALHLCQCGGSPVAAADHSLHII